ncbi:MAG: hypothetical protein ABL889_16470 [Terricaulis sp.]
MGCLRAIPLLLFPAILYAAVAMTMDHGAIRASLDQIFLSINLPSGADFTVTRGHALTMLAAGLLFIEVVKSTSTSTASLVENVLAFVVFIVAFIFFLLNPAFGTIEFALIMAMMLIDFMAGFVVMTISSRRDVSWA